MALRHGVFAFAPALIVVFILYLMVRMRAVGVDFAGPEWFAGRRVLEGLSPYANPHSQAVLNGGAYLHPAVAALLMTPFSLMPKAAGAATFVLLNMLAVVVTLRALGVRDWRIYGPALVWPPVISGWQTANITLLLGLGIALAWRYRDEPWVCGVAVGVIVSAKLFLWPLGLWLIGTRRYRASGYAIAVGVAANITAWAVLGFSELPRYLELMRAATAARLSRGYSIFALALHHGVSHSAAYAVVTAIAALAGMTCVLLGRRGRDAAALATAVGVCLLATPVIWLHYFALLIVPVAIAKPRIGIVWALPFVMLGFPVTDPADLQVVVALIVGTALVVAALRAPQTVAPDMASRRAHSPRAMLAGLSEGRAAGLLGNVRRP